MFIRYRHIRYKTIWSNAATGIDINTKHIYVTLGAVSFFLDELKPNVLQLSMKIIKLLAIICVKRI